MQAVDEIVPYREFRVKGQTEDWFDGEIMDGIKNSDKLLKNYKKSKLEVHHQIYRKAKIEASKLIKIKQINIWNKRSIVSLLYCLRDKNIGTGNVEIGCRKLCARMEGKTMAFVRRVMTWKIRDGVRCRRQAQYNNTKVWQ